MLRACPLIAFKLPLSKQGNERENNTPCYYRAYLSPHVGTYRGHQQVVVRVLFLSHLVNYPCRHRERRYTAGSHHGVDLVALFPEEVQELGENHPAKGVEHEGKESQADDDQRI